MRDKNSLKSYGMLLASLFIFGTLGVYRKFLTVTSASISFYRSVFGALFLILFMKLKGKNIKQIFKLELKAFLLLFLAGIILGVNWLLLFEGYKYAAVSLVILCCYMEPLFVIIMSAVLFHERLTLKKILCFTAALIGMILISGVIETGLPDQSSLTGMLYGLGSGLFYALLVIVNKFIKGVDADIKTIIQLIGAAVSMIPYIIFTNAFADDLWTVQSIILMAVICVVNTALAYTLYFGSMDGLQAHTIALLSYIDPVTTLSLAALILGERLTAFGILGAVLILGSAVICELN